MAAAAAAAAAPSTTFQCLICLEEGLDSATRRVVLPCCGRTAPHLTYCDGCVELLCREASTPGFGRCPTCRAYYGCQRDGATGRLQVSLLTNVGLCNSCNQSRVLSGRFCDACHLGRRLPLRYRCVGCNGVGRIPHPMWRYQPTPGAPSTDKWSCPRCQDFTYWTIVPEDVRFVPLDDAPASWGTQEQWYAHIRAARQQQPNGRPTHVAPAAAAAGGNGHAPPNQTTEARREFLLLIALAIALAIAYWMEQR